ncbi:MAG: hypothetical protein IT193_09085 [Propionibacteriaceae bacterium]|nr:hypothetical protein [Propionibacteriaceae bacterium]
MGDGSLTFAIPVRDPRGVADWATVKDLIGVTVRSLTAQAGPAPAVVLGVSPGTDLPRLPDQVLVVDVDLPFEPLPEGEGPARWEAIRADKGLRLAHALAAARPQGHAMVVDYDDLVSTRLAAVVAAEPDAPGWYVDSGYLWDGGPFASVKATGFNEVCGSSLIVRADLLRLPDDPSDPAHLDWIKTILGSHKAWREYFTLEPLAFPGAVYRVGAGHNVSQAEGIARRLYYAARRPRELPATVGALRPWASVRKGFGA